MMTTETKYAFMDDEYVDEDEPTTAEQPNTPRLFYFHGSTRDSSGAYVPDDVDAQMAAYFGYPEVVADIERSAPPHCLDPAVVSLDCL